MVDGPHLTTGWESDLPADDSLLRQFVFATAERNAALAEAAGGRARSTSAAALADAGSPILFDNAVTLLAPTTAEGARRVVADALDFFPADIPFAVLSAWPIPEAGDLGIELMGHPPFMFRPPGPAPVRPTDLAIRPVVDAAGLGDFWRTIVAAYPMPGTDSALARPTVLESGVRLWVGYDGERAVGTAGAYVSHGVVDVEWISVYEDCRGRGFGQALSWTATLADPGLPAVLIASDPGQPVYERMGYVRLTRMSMWFRPARGA